MSVSVTGSSGYRGRSRPGEVGLENVLSVSVIVIERWTAQHTSNIQKEEVIFVNNYLK